MRNIEKYMDHFVLVDGILVDKVDSSVTVDPKYGEFIDFHSPFDRIFDYECDEEKDKKKWLAWAIDRGLFTTHTEDNNSFFKEIVMYLTEKGVVFKVIQLGGGVKTITHVEDVCPYCSGTGMRKGISKVEYPHSQRGKI